MINKNTQNRCHVSLVSPHCCGSHEVIVSVVQPEWPTFFTALSYPTGSAAAPACLAVAHAVVLTFTPLLAVCPKTAHRALCPHTATRTNRQRKRERETWRRETFHRNSVWLAVQHAFFSPLPTLSNWTSQGTEFGDIPATRLEVSCAGGGGGSWHSPTAKGCNSHWGRIECEGELRGRSSQNIITGSIQKHTHCQQITRLLAEINELRPQIKL